MEEYRIKGRDSLFLSATMRLSNQSETLRIRVRNLSAGGMMAECPVHVECGDRLMTDLRNVGWVSGSVAWVFENRFGVTFDNQIDCKAVRRPINAGDAEPEMRVRRPLAVPSAPPPEPEESNLRRI